MEGVKQYRVIRILYFKSESNILWHLEALLGTDREISNYTRAVAK
jgi:hypothetical protein